MWCSSCQSALYRVELDNQIILHCAYCGGSFFDENGINRITLEDARKLRDDRMVGDHESATEQLCPKDQTILQRLQHSEAVPHDASLFQCSRCYGIFVTADDLVYFKKAQAAKINFFQTWHLPLPSVRSVLVLSVTLFIFASALLGFLKYTGSTPTKLRADEVVKQVSFNPSGRYILASFHTTSPLRSQIIITDETTQKSSRITISSQPKTVHVATITNVETSDNLFYQIELFDNQGRSIKTAKKKVQFSIFKSQ